MNLTRRSLFRSAAAGVAAAAVPKALTVAAAPATAPVAEAAAQVAAGIPVLDVLKKVLNPYGYGDFQVKLLSDQVYETNSSRSYPTPGRSCFGHVRSAIFGEDRVAAMLADPVGRPLVMSEVLDDTYYCHSGYHSYPPVDFAPVAEALRQDGRLGDARRLLHAKKALEIQIKVKKLLDDAMQLRQVWPKKIYELNQAWRDRTTNHPIPLAQVPRRALAIAREQKKLVTRLVRIGPDPGEKARTWLQQYRREYGQIRSQIISERKWGEFRWLDGILKERRRMSRWSAAYKIKRRAYFERELAERLRIRDVVMDALVEHRLAGRDEETEVCLGTAARLRTLESVTREALEAPPEVSPLEVGIEALAQWMRKRLLPEKWALEEKWRASQALLQTTYANSNSSQEAEAKLRGLQEQFERRQATAEGKGF